MKVSLLAFWLHLVLGVLGFGLATWHGVHAIAGLYAALTAGQMPGPEHLDFGHTFAAFLALAVTESLWARARLELPVVHVTIPKTVLGRMQARLSQVHGPFTAMAFAAGIATLAGHAWSAALADHLLVNVRHASVAHVWFGRSALALTVIATLLAVFVATPRLLLMLASATSILRRFNSRVRQGGA